MIAGNGSVRFSTRESRENKKPAYLRMAISCRNRGRMTIAARFPRVVRRVVEPMGTVCSASSALTGKQVHS